MIFLTAVESGQQSLLDLVVGGHLEARVPGAAQLLASRCLYSVVVTVENLLQFYGLVPSNITLGNLFLRADNQSGVLHSIGLVQASPFVTRDMVPLYYPSANEP